MKELERKLEECPNCGRRVSNMKYCPDCGIKLPEKEAIKLDEIFALARTERETNIYLYKNRLQSLLNEITPNEIDEYVKERSDQFIEVNFMRGLKYYINKQYQITKLEVEYEFKFDDNRLEELDVSIKLSNPEKQFKISEEFPFYLSVGIGDEFGNRTYLIRFTDILYTMMKSFSLLPELNSCDTIHNDFCPYALRDIIEKMIEQYSEEFPEEYNSIILAKEIK